MKPTLLKPEFLNRVWQDWLKGETLTLAEKLNPRFYEVYPGRGTNKGRRFDDWIFQRGGCIRRINREFHLEFDKPEDVSYFLLRWG